MYMVNDKTYGSSQQIGTDILLIDIDNYEDRHALETLSLFLDFYFSFLVLVQLRSTTVIPAPPNCICSSAKWLMPGTVCRYWRISVRKIPVPVP